MDGKQEPPFVPSFPTAEHCPANIGSDFPGQDIPLRHQEKSTRMELLEQQRNEFRTST